MSYLLAPDHPKIKPCPDCGGKGFLVDYNQSGFDPCERCECTGEIVINEDDEESRHVDDMVDRDLEEKYEDETELPELSN